MILLGLIATILRVRWLVYTGVHGLLGSSETRISLVLREAFQGRDLLSKL